MKALLFSAQLLLLVLLWDYCEGLETDNGNYTFCYPKGSKNLRKKRDTGEADDPVEIIPYSDKDGDEPVSSGVVVPVARSSENTENNEKPKKGNKGQKNGKGRNKRQTREPVKCTENEDCPKKCGCQSVSEGQKYCVKV
ncbi:uncharacterized protein LOC119389041 [Rhipicephalus sanguineus]|uniref:uncharacterized protein LOC119389041 n=1 Tax=Rhipicephalus sanguineus TaxID=34632 RepID=UPI001894C6EA|nr:uncharacterized protein LOC119389041 [Rhipicephalus sanguineus]